MMSGGSLKDLVRSINSALSAPVSLQPLPDDVVNVIQEYLNRHSNIDEHESQRLHDELLNIHVSKVQGHPDRLAVFLSCFRTLRPAIFGVEHLLKWWEVLVKPTLDSMGQARAVVADARAIVLSVLACEDEDDPTGQKAQASSVFTDKLFEIFLEKTRLPDSAERGAGIKEEQKRRFVSANVEAVLLAYGKRRAQAFLGKVDSFIMQKEYRLQILGLLCSYVRLQGPHLYQVLQTPLLDHLLKCLENDTSTTVISLALTVLIMFMPHLCNSLAAYLPRLFVVYTRVLCWDKFRIVRMEESKLFGIESLSRTGTPLSAERHEENIGGNSWQKLNSSFETATSTTPDVSDYFSFLYGLYPINFLLFIREPYKFLERANYKDIDHLDIEEETIRQRTELYRQRHILHPNFLTLTAETELSDQSRWMKVEPADITAQCIGLVNNSIPADDYRKPIRSTSKSALPDALLPIEDIPTESLLSQEEEGRSTHGEVGGHNWRESDSISSTYPSGVNARPKLYSLFPRPNTATPSRGEKTPDSPTIPPATAFDSTGEAHVQDMLKLQEQLQASLQDSASKKDDKSPPHGVLPRPPAGQAPTYPNSLTASPRLDAYAQSLNQNNAPRSPALRPAASDAHETISYLQREVMLLKNDLNFERYLKQQHLSHIGHLQRKHIKESTAEAETQNLINTNKTLKAKLEEAKKAYSASRQEALKSKNQAKKWEAELSAKIRTLREEQKAWRQDEESTKKALGAAKEETDHLQKLLTESEAEGLRSRQKLQSLRAEMEEVNKLRSFVDHLSKKLSEYEDRSEHFEMQRHNEEDALSQVERMKLRLVTREQEMQQMKRSYEGKLKEIESRLSSMSHPMPTVPGPNFQGMIDNALSVANGRLATLRKAHNRLLQKYTELEIRCIELQASQEMSEVDSPIGSQALNQCHDMHSPSESESNHPSQRDHNYNQFQQHYAHSEDSMSPHSSFTESSAFHGASGYGSPPNNPSSPGLMSAGFMPSKYSFGGQPSSNAMGVRPRLRHQPSMPESLISYNAPMTVSAFSDDGRSMKTVKSSTSSEKRAKVAPKSDIRVRGRGGVQNIGKTPKDKDKDKDQNKEGVGEKPKKKSRFSPGSGLAGIRGFV